MRREDLWLYLHIYGYNTVEMSEGTTFSPIKREIIMPSTTRTTGINVPAWPKYALRITFGVIWMIDAVLKWLPGFRSGYMASIKGAGMGQPGWLQWWFHLWTNMQHPAPTFWAVVVAILETLVALAVILGFARKVSYIATAIIYALVFVCLLTLAAYTGTDRYSADYYLERKISWWHEVAEVGHQVQEQPVPAAVVPTQRGPVAPTLNGTTRPESVSH